MYSLTTYRSILRSESYNEIYAWNQSCTRLPGSFMTFSASVVLAVMQKGHEQGEWRLLILLFTIRKRRPLHYSADAYRTYRIQEAFLIFTNSAYSWVRRREFVVATWTPYIDRAMRWRLNEVENARDVHWRVTSLF